MVAYQNTKQEMRDVQVLMWQTAGFSICVLTIHELHLLMTDLAQLYVHGPSDLSYVLNIADVYENT